MTDLPIRRGTAARLGLRHPKRPMLGLIQNPAASDEQMAEFKLQRGLGAA